MNDATVNLSRNCTHITIEKLVCFLQYIEKIHVTNATSEKEISMILKVMSESKNVDVVQKFIDSLVELFQDCFRELKVNINNNEKLNLKKCLRKSVRIVLVT